MQDELKSKQKDEEVDYYRGFDPYGNNQKQLERLDRFVVAALTGILCCRDLGTSGEDPKRICEISWRYAKLMLAMEDFNEK